MQPHRVRVQSLARRPVRPAHLALVGVAALLVVGTANASPHLADPNDWTLAGNAIAAGQFLGTTNAEPLELKVNTVRALRLESPSGGAPNLIGGAPDNSAAPSVVGATIGGGGDSGSPNQVIGNFGTVSGGTHNVAGAGGATVGGGEFNVAAAVDATVAGGQSN